MFYAESLRRTPLLVDRTAEVFQELLVLHTFQPFFFITHHLISTCGKYIRRQPVITYCQQTFVRFDVYIISTSESLLSAGVDIGAQMILVGRLIRRAPGIAVESVSCILGQDMFDRRIKFRDSQYSLGYAIFEVLSHFKIFRFMFQKPLSVVISRHVF